MLFGAHVYVAAGYDKTLEYALEVGCECMQIFGKSPRQWVAPPIDAEKAERFVEARAQVGFGPVFTHAAYLINLATPDPVIRAKSIEALADEIVRGAALDATGVVTHVGNDADETPALAANRVAEAVLEAFELAGPRGSHTRLLLENTAGAGRTFGASLEELAACIGATGLPAERLGVCFDTCHAWAYGMPVDTADGWQSVAHEMRTTIGLERLGLFHSNDCLHERGSKRDRHAWIGDGFIGSEGFRAMVCRAEFKGLCACLEVAGDVPEKDVVNLSRLKELRASCRPSQTGP